MRNIGIYIHILLAHLSITSNMVYVIIINHMDLYELNIGVLEN